MVDGWDIFYGFRFIGVDGILSEKSEKKKRKGEREKEEKNEERERGKDT